jgi:hypothetical protein
VRRAGLAPCPIALLTIGLLLLSDGRRPLLLLLIPVLWTLVAGATGWSLGIPHDAVLPLASIAAISVILWDNHRRLSAPGEGN